MLEFVTIIGYFLYVLFLTPLIPIIIPIVLSKQAKKNNKKILLIISRIWNAVNISLLTALFIYCVYNSISYNHLETKSSGKELYVIHTNNNLSASEDFGFGDCIIEDADVIKLSKEFSKERFKIGKKTGFLFTAKKQGTTNILIKIIGDVDEIHVYRVTVDESLNISYEYKQSISLNNLFNRSYTINIPAPSSAYYVDINNNTETEIKDVNALQKNLNTTFGYCDYPDEVNFDEMNYLKLIYDNEEEPLILYIDADNTFYINHSSSGIKYYHLTPDEWMDTEYITNLQMK